MKIERTINGVKFNIELLPDELAEAYFEQQKKFDIENVIDYAEAMGEEELEREYDCTYAKYLSLKEEIASNLRWSLDMGSSFQAAIDFAVDRVLKDKALAV